MYETKKRYPTDRLKLHALLEKKEQDLSDLKAEVEDLRARTLEADRTAIIANCELYSLTPELLAEFLKAKFGGNEKSIVLELPEGAQPVAALSEYPVKPKEEDDEDED